MIDVALERLACLGALGLAIYYSADEPEQFSRTLVGLVLVDFRHLGIVLQLTHPRGEGVDGGVGTFTVTMPAFATRPQSGIGRFAYRFLRLLTSSSTVGGLASVMAHTAR